MHLRVLTWNTLHRDRSSRIGSLSKVITHIAPDVVMLQESSPEHADEVAQRTGLHVTAVPDVDSDDATSVPALLTRVPMTGSVVSELPAANDDHRYWAVSGTWTEGECFIQLTSTHLRHTHLAGRMGLDADYRLAAQQSRNGHAGPMQGDPSIADSVALRLRQLQALNDFLTIPRQQTSASILGGDFNFVPNGPEYQAVMHQGWSDAWHAAPRLGSGSTILDRNPLIADNPAPYRDVTLAKHPGGSAHPDYTLDFQFVRGNMTVNDAWTVGDPGHAGGQWPSDHLGIVVNYEI
ncbi:endonuclease/exonuclease/phosphatase family protein [Subtercola sp. RTI3]|uniref:endonuclease/exonuclease/phosphatase family protein n=1 Tax=Subtercola sp. RTI3 TaxID=3048639 RepID=UPI002B2260E3|nr:endonuclease/exonuclease/phosphatase family protein [Subtercola sp. RTI3]MEA9987054.1 endonuclease/exonuclease/phosphatase family protein [Subtercola sp. RTI3]